VDENMKIYLSDVLARYCTYTLSLFDPDKEKLNMSRAYGQDIPYLLAEIAILEENLRKSMAWCEQWQDLILDMPEPGKRTKANMG